MTHGIKRAAEGVYVPRRPCRTQGIDESQLQHPRLRSTQAPAIMKRGFYTIMAAQFFSSLADNALLIAAIAQLLELDGRAWMVPLLKFFFTVSYVALAACVGAFADAIPKGRVMFITNTIKIAGCVMMFFTDYVEFAGIPGYALVLAAYAVVGFGAAAYSPAKYGILTELLPPEKLVAANGWIEGLTVASIILGTVLGGALISPRIASLLLAIDVPHLDTGIETPAEAAILVISAIYVIAALFNLFIPDTGVRYGLQQTNPALLVVIGALAAFFVVPMNALLQHRGYVLLSAGHSIAVQNFNENISILLMLAIYSAMIKANVHINTIIVAFGSFVVLAMLGVMLRHRYNQSRGDSLHLIGMKTSKERGYP